MCAGAGWATTCFNTLPAWVWPREIRRYLLNEAGLCSGAWYAFVDEEIHRYVGENPPLLLFWRWDVITWVIHVDRWIRSGGETGITQALDDILLMGIIIMA